MIGQVVVLRGPEMLISGFTGVARYVEAIVNKRTALNYQPEEKSAGDHVMGAMAEAAVAKARGCYWCGEWLNHRAPDVAGLQVRWTSYASGMLLLQPGDKDDDFYVLVTGIAPNFVIRGGCYGREGKVQKYWGALSERQKDRPCFKIPQSDLKDLPEV